jgi:serine/threonine-protein kinase
VLEQALAKNPSIRTPSVGALADAVGHAYGLAGDHRKWAVTPQQDLGREIAEAVPRLMAAKVAPLGVAADPFASPPFGGLAEPMGTGRGMDQAFGAIREAELVPQGVPSAKPGWLLPLIVGLLALFVGGAVTLVVMGH